MIRRSSVFILALLLLFSSSLFPLIGCEGLRYQPSAIVVIPGEEDTSSLLHLICLNTAELNGAVLVQDMQNRIDDVSSSGGLPIVAHPSSLGFFDRPETTKLNGYAGVEINSAQDLTRWDSLLAGRLSRGEPLVWGFMSNDSNNSPEYEGGFLMLRSPGLDLDNIIASLREGCFYWGTGSLVADIAVEGSKITIRLNERAYIQFIASGGQIMAETTGRAAEYTASGSEGYVRIEIESPNGKKAGTQPLRVRAEGISNPYAIQGRWYKGNLHTHSTGSSGPFPRDEVIKLYRQNGYSFIAVTDAVDWLLPSEISV
jgi:hypothetical protein